MIWHDMAAARASVCVLLRGPFDVLAHKPHRTWGSYQTYVYIANYVGCVYCVLLIRLRVPSACVSYPLHCFVTPLFHCIR